METPENLLQTPYCPSMTEYRRRPTVEVKIGEVPLGSMHPIRVQSMTTADTMDTAATVEEALRMYDAGSEYIRVTAPSVKEAQNLENIRRELRKRGCYAPLVADIHFTPKAAEMAARLVEKVRINPGNYADKKRFEEIEYTDESYQAELERIRERFLPLVRLCKEYGTAMRIGTNHGSLSDRIMSRYGDTPQGMVMSALEFLEICEDEGFYNTVLSMKASNTRVMVQAYRLLVQQLDARGLQPYPLHLGVTEAGEAEDGRIKSAVGVGTLLEDGLGDTIRVSLTEAAENEIPVAKALAERYSTRPGHRPIPDSGQLPLSPFDYERRKSTEVFNFGGDNPPRVIGDAAPLPQAEMKELKAFGHHYLPELDKWTLSDWGADFLFSGDRPLPFMLANGTRQVVAWSAWQSLPQDEKKTSIPFVSSNEFIYSYFEGSNYVLVRCQIGDIRSEGFQQRIQEHSGVVLVLYSENAHAMAEMRQAFFTLIDAGIEVPVVIERSYPEDLPADHLMLYAATDVGGLLVDGLGDGVLLRLDRYPENREAAKRRLGQLNNIAFQLLQAARTRMSKTEYISCPSCGRTLFDLQETTAMIRKRTDHLKGVKIGIMGCIVNGPGEMADADYGYVGIGKDKIALYRNKERVKRAVPAANAVDELIELIKEDGKWIEPEDTNN